MTAVKATFEKVSNRKITISPAEIKIQSSWVLNSGYWNNEGTWINTKTWEFPS